MKKIFFTLLLLSLFACDNTFYKGKDLYNKKEYELAIIEFKSVSINSSKYEEAQKMLSLIDSIIIENNKLTQAKKMTDQMYGYIELCEKQKISKAELDKISKPLKVKQDSLRKILSFEQIKELDEYFHTQGNEKVDRLIKYKEEIKWYNSKAGRIQKKHPNWTKEECQNVADNLIWIGMSIDMVKYERGNPDKINISNYGNGNQYQYV